MDERSQKKLEEILAKHISAITETDKVFLKARRTYIPNKKQKELKDILGAEVVVPVTPPTDETNRADWSEHPADEQTDSAEDEDDEAEG
jgi:hypothetical protein